MLAYCRKAEVELASRITYDKPANPAYNQPIGTRSIMEIIFNAGGGEELAYVHYYLLPDGVTIGASGQKDPKRVIFSGVDYRIRTRLD